MLPEPVAATLMVVDALDALGVPYLIGGSLAGATYRLARATADADPVAALRPEHAAPPVRALGGAFCADEESIRDAVQRRSSFYLIRLETMFKVGIFVTQEPPLDRVQLRRRSAQTTRCCAPSLPRVESPYL